MLEELATVIALEQVQNQEYAQLEVVRKNPCALCGKTRGCGVSLWGKLFKHGQKPLRLKNSIQAKVGDDVVIAIEEQAFLKSTLYLYGVPLLAMLLGAVLATYWVANWGVNAQQGANTDAYTLSGAVAGLLLGYIWLKGHQMGAQFQAHCQPTLIKIAPKSAQNQPILLCERSH
jgi:sigma-E factor negative regulatory protein RseC